MATYALETLEMERLVKQKWISQSLATYKDRDEQQSILQQNILNAQQELDSLTDAIERIRPGGSKAPKMLEAPAGLTTATGFDVPDNIEVLQGGRNA